MEWSKLGWTPILQKTLRMPLSACWIHLILFFSMPATTRIQLFRSRASHNYMMTELGVCVISSILLFTPHSYLMPYHAGSSSIQLQNISFCQLLFFRDLPYIDRCPKNSTNDPCRRFAFSLKFQLPQLRSPRRSLLTGFPDDFASPGYFSTTLVRVCPHLVF